MIVELCCTTPIVTCLVVRCEAPSGIFAEIRIPEKTDDVMKQDCHINICKYALATFVVKIQLNIESLSKPKCNMTNISWWLHALVSINSVLCKSICHIEKSWVDFSAWSFLRKLTKQCMSVVGGYHYFSLQWCSCWATDNIGTYRTIMGW